MRTHVVAIALGTIVAGMSVASCKGCKGDDEVPPMPSATAAPSEAPPLELSIEDAGDEPDADDAGDGDAAKGGPYISNLVACCRTLAQNAKSNANPLVAGSMMQAAAVCESYARQGNASGVNSALSQFGMKCK